MGICFSKKKGPGPPPSNPTPNEPPKGKKVEKKEKRRVEAGPQQVVAEATEKKPIFVITQNKKSAVPSAVEKGKNNEKQHPKKKAQQDVDRSGGRGGAAAVVDEHPPVASVRTSSCTKEELDTILIQCGHLSRSSSGGGHRMCSGSNRSYDFDKEKRGDFEEWEKPATRPSPHRRTLIRERDGDGEYKRPRSRERGSGGGRRMSRSPGRRSGGPSSSNQPGKMVSVPAREKDGASEVDGVVVKRASIAVSNKRGLEMGGMRSASPRSGSPAKTTRISNENTLYHKTQSQSLSRNSSPYRRNPMAEIDENIDRAEQQYPSRSQRGSSNANKLQKPSQSQPQKAMSKVNQKNVRTAEISNGIKGNNNIRNCVLEQLMSCRTKEQRPEPEIVKEDTKVTRDSNGVEVPVEVLNPRTITRTRSSRRSSKDLDHYHTLGLNADTHLNPTSYNSLLLEDDQTSQQQNNTAFSLPACISKACSILEAVADLNSSLSHKKNYDAEGSNSEYGGYRMRDLGRREPFVESDIVVKDDLMEPSLQKYITVSGVGVDMEPQESAGSNSFAGQPWASPWEPNSSDSTNRCWTSWSNNDEDIEKEQQSFSTGRRSRMPGSCTNSVSATTRLTGKNREFDHCQLNRADGNGKTGDRASSFPIATAASY